MGKTCEGKYKRNCERNERYIARYISQLHRKARSFVNKSVAKHGFKSGQIMFLIELYRQDGKSQEEISESLQIDKGTTARAMRKLEEEGYVTRAKDKEDKRFNSIYLTQKSQDLREDVYSVFDEWHDKIGECLTEEEEVQLRQLLEKVCKNIKI